MSLHKQGLRFLLLMARASRANSKHKTAQMQGIV